MQARADRQKYDPAPSPNTTTGKADGTPVPAWTGESIDNVLKRFGRYDLLRYMNAYWGASQATPRAGLMATVNQARYLAFPSVSDTPGRL